MCKLIKISLISVLTLMYLIIDIFCLSKNDAELFGRTLRVNLAKPIRMSERSSRPVWADDEWLSKYSGQHTIAQQVKWHILDIRRGDPFGII